MTDRRAFARYVGIDYSGAETATASLPGLRIYLAGRSAAAVEVLPARGRRKHWSRRWVAEWLLERLREAAPTLVGIDHAFSFPLPYFEAHGIARDWTVFLEDFRRHWPTDEDGARVSEVRRAAGAARSGDSRWRRLADRRARAKSPFQFGVQGSVAHSTHAGLPWLLYLRRQVGERVHVWPFDGWRIPAGRSAVVEVYPSLWRGAFPRKDRSPDQHDAFSAAEWMRRADRDARLAGYFQPSLTPEERAQAEVEGWILGVG